MHKDDSRDLVTGEFVKKERWFDLFFYTLAIPNTIDDDHHQNVSKYGFRIKRFKISHLQHGVINVRLYDLPTVINTTLKQLIL
ncbi:hypothetical protein [Staphylococcus intermedius]|uniref:hypothetical protein n=1 Tax=Staphylococcus intermedius TaxID=1285 RepID=UPI00115520E5|nr:hypothetical protein [Staphylococcus intermedius]